MITVISKLLIFSLIHIHTYTHTHTHTHTHTQKYTNSDYRLGILAFIASFPPQDFLLSRTHVARIFFETLRNTRFGNQFYKWSLTSLRNTTRYHRHNCF